jgi:hypothetical protein
MIPVFTDWISGWIRRRLLPFDLVDHVASVAETVKIGGRGYLIRPFVASDMGAVLTLARRAYIEEMAPLTNGLLSERLVAKMECSGPLVKSAFTILAGDEICGFARYICWTNVLLQEKYIENLFIYIQPEHRSFTLFRRLGSVFERAGDVLGADKVLFSFENGISPEAKGRAAERLGFTRISAFLGKAVDLGVSPARRAVPASLPSIKALLYVRKKSRLKPIDFVLYTLGMVAYVKREARRGCVFLELSEPSESLLLARTAVRVLDDRKLALVTIICNPTPDMMDALTAWAIQNQCVEILINTKEVGDDPCLTFREYRQYGFSVRGYILSKAVAVRSDR